MANRFKVNTILLNSQVLQASGNDLFCNGILVGSGYLTLANTGQFYPYSNPEHFSTSGNVELTGTNLITRMAGLSGQLNISGGNLQTQITSLASVRSVTGLGTPFYVPRFTANGSGLTNSVIFETGGSVGIGTTGPSAKLDVNGYIRSTSLTSTPTTGIGLEITFDSAGGQGYVNSLDRYTITWKSLNIDGSNIFLNTQSAGSVGIGNTSPISKLDVSGNIYALGGKVITRQEMPLNSATGLGTPFYVPRFTANGSGLTNSAIFETGGNVGIGTTSPAYNLEVGNGTENKFVKVNGGGSASSDGGFYLIGNNTTNVGGIGNPSAYLGGTYNNHIGVFGLNGVDIYTNNTRQVSIDTFGNVGINTTSPISKLDVSGVINSSGITVVNNVASTSNLNLISNNTNTSIILSGNSINFYGTTSGAPPSNTTTPVAWMDIYVSGLLRKLPLYI